MNKRREKNRGSMIVEYTLLMPVFLGVVYLYILCFLLLVQQGGCMEAAAEALYQKQSFLKYEEIQKGNKRSIVVKQENGSFRIEGSFKGVEQDAIKTIRRWQIAIDTVS